MLEFFKTISSYWDKLVNLFDTVFDYIQSSVTELYTWLSYLPASLVAAGGIIMVVIVIYKVLGRS